MKVKKKMKFKKMYNVNKSRWVHTKGNCTPRYLLPASVLKKRCLCASKKESIALQVVALTVGIMSKVHKIFDEIVTTADRVRSQIMNVCEKMQAIPTPGHHFHHYIAIPAAYKRKSKSGVVFDSDSFDVQLDSMASAYMSPQKCHFDEYEEIHLG